MNPPEFAGEPRQPHTQIKQKAERFVQPFVYYIIQLLFYLFCNFGSALQSKMYVRANILLTHQHHNAGFEQ